MQWQALTDPEQLDALIEQSRVSPQVIFKHSTRCSISSMALHRLERSETPAGAVFHLLDLLRYRPLSQAIAERFAVHHESPQVLIIRHGECVYDESHSGINMDEIREMIAQ